MKCPCNTECTDCVAGFQKIISLNNAGLVIYRRTTETKYVNNKTGNVDYADNTIEDIYILHNTKDTDISSADYWPEIGHDTINCPRCKKIIEHAQKLLIKGPTISGNDVTGICDHCKMKDKPCYKCRQVVKRFVPGKPDRTDIKKERVKHWLTKIGYLLQDINNITVKKKRAHSDTHIDQICHDHQRSGHKPDVEQLFQPLELDLAGISNPYIDSRINGQSKEKKPVAHFPQLEKLETQIVFKDPLKKNVPSTSALFKEDEILGERSNFNVRRKLKPDRQILTNKNIASPVRINSSQTVSNDESVVSFEQIFKDKIGTGTQQGAKTHRNITQTDETIGIKPNEAKDSPKIVISEKNKEKLTSPKRSRSVQPLEKIKKAKLLDTKAKESERTELLRKYHSAENLKVHGITEHNFKKANRIIFPRQQSNKPTEQKSSSELIKDTKDKLTIAEEQKKLKKIFYEQTGQQSDEKEMARKKSGNAIDHQESAVDDKQNAIQEAKQSMKSNEKDDFRTEEEVHRTRKDSQKFLKDTDITEEKSRKSEKDADKATKAEKDDYTSEKGAKKSTEDAQKVEEDGNKSKKEAQNAPKDARKFEKDGYKSEKATKAEKDDYSSEKGTKKTTKDAPQTTKNGITYEKGAKKFTEDAQKVEQDGYKSRKEAQKAPKEARKEEKDGYKSEKGAEKATKAEKDAYTSEKGTKKITKDAPQTTKNGITYEKGAKKSTEDAQKVEEDGYKSKKESQKAPKDARKVDKDGYKSEKGAEKATKAEKDDYTFEKGTKKTAKDAPQTTKYGITNEKGAKKSTEDAQKVEEDGYKSKREAQKAPKEARKEEKDGYKSEKGTKKYTKDAQVAERDGHQFEKVAQKTPRDAQKAKKDGHENEKDAQNTPRDQQKAERGGYIYEKSGKEPTKDTHIAVKNTHKFEKGAQNMPTDAQMAKNNVEISSQKEQKHVQKAELRQKTTKELKSLGDAQKDMTPKSPKSGQKLEKEVLTEVNAKNIVMEAADFEFEKQIALKSKQKTQALEKKPKTEPPSELKKNKDQELKLKEGKEKENALKKRMKEGKKEVLSTEIDAKKITMKAADLEFEEQVGLKLNQKPQALQKKTQTELPYSQIRKMNDQELKLKAEQEKTDNFKKKLDDEVMLDTRLGAKPISHDLFEMKSIKIKQDVDDLILKLVRIKQSTCDGDRVRNIPVEPIKDMRLLGQGIQVPKLHILHNPPQSETCISWTDDDSKLDEKELQIRDVIIGPQICTIKPLKLHDDLEVKPPLLKSGYDSSRIEKKQEIAQTPEKSKTNESIKPPENEKQETVVSTETPRIKEAMKPRPLLSPGSNSKGFVRYTLSDRKFIDNGWTLLPTEKVVRKMNVYRMRPARPEFDWFEHNKYKRLMEYDTGEKLAEFDDNGRGRWFYRNGRMALDYYNAEELNAGQRFVIYSNGEPDERGRSRPYTLLATFDYSGNGIVFDHRGKIRLKYNQTEGVVLDRSIGPVSHWKWHTLNDPPVLQQVMLDTQIAHKDPKIMKMGGPNDNMPRKDNEEMLAIEFDNFIKEKSKKLSQTFKPFQIKMKALKINEHFSLRVLDQATVYLLYRDGTTNLKLNIGMVLNQKEIVDTDTAEVGEVSSSMEKLPARTESLAGLQRSVAHAQHYDWKRTERERKMHPAEPSASVDKLVAGTSRPLRPPSRPVPSQSTSLTTTEHCKCSRKPTSTSVYYDTRFC